MENKDLIEQLKGFKRNINEAGFSLYSVTLVTEVGGYGFEEIFQVVAVDKLAAQKRAMKKAAEKAIEKACTNVSKGLDVLIHVSSCQVIELDL